MGRGSQTWCHACGCPAPLRCVHDKFDASHCRHLYLAKALTDEQGIDEGGNEDGSEGDEEGGELPELEVRCS